MAADPASPLTALLTTWRAKGKRRYDDAERLRNVGEDERAYKMEARADENIIHADELEAALALRDAAQTQGGCSCPCHGEKWLCEDCCDGGSARG